MSCAELIDEVSIRPVNLHAIEARMNGIARRPAEVFDDAPDLVLGQCARRRAGNHRADPGGRVDLPDLTIERHCGRGDRQLTIVKVRMGHAAHVPELQEDPAAGRMNRSGHETPTFDLVRAVDARGERIALALRRYLRGLGHDQRADARWA